MASASADPQGQPAPRRNSLAAFDSPGGVTTSAQPRPQRLNVRNRVPTAKGSDYALSLSQAQSDGGGDEDDTATGEAHRGPHTNPGQACDWLHAREVASLGPENLRLVP
jgi:hypothetical protein